MEQASFPPSPSSSMEALLEGLFCHPDHAEPSQISRALEQILFRHASEPCKTRFLDCAAAFDSHFHSELSRLRRQHDTLHNSLTWPLTHDLTIKVFSFLNMHSLCQAAASCTLFNKIAMEPECYKDIDLTGPSLLLNDGVIVKIIERARQHLRSLKLGLIYPTKVDELGAVVGERLMPNDSKLLNISGVCLSSIPANNWGAMLTTLHLFYTTQITTHQLCEVLSGCPLLADLQVIGLYVNTKEMLQSVTQYCRGLKHLCIQQAKLNNCWHSSSIQNSSCNQIVQWCPSISSLSLRGCNLTDQKAKLLIKGLHHLVEVDFTNADRLTGSFLRDLVRCKHSKLKSLKLRDCVRLRAVEVKKLLFAVGSGECKSLRHLDVSNKDGLAVSDRFHPRSSISAEIVSSVRKYRPEIDLCADFPEEKSFKGASTLTNYSYNDGCFPCKGNDIDSMSLVSSLGYSDGSGPLRPRFLTEEDTSEDSEGIRSISHNGSAEDIGGELADYYVYDGYDDLADVYF